MIAYLTSSRERTVADGKYTTIPVRREPYFCCCDRVGRRIGSNIYLDATEFWEDVGVDGLKEVRYVDTSPSFEISA